MSNNRTRQLKRDCRAFLPGVIFLCFLHRLTGLATPTFLARLMGDMSDSLLRLDTPAILSALPPFLFAVSLQVLLVPGWKLVLNLLLTKQGFSYDAFLMNKFIRLPLSSVEKVEAGALMERLEEDSAALCWNQMVICAYPGAIGVFACVLGYLLFAGNKNILFSLGIVLFSALPVVYTIYIGKVQARLKKMASEYQDSRKQMEQELLQGKDFSKIYHLHPYFTGRLDRLFQSFLEKNGKMQYRISAKTQVLGYLCDYGSHLSVILLGAFLMCQGSLSLGTLLSGYLMLPTISQSFRYIQEWVTEIHNQKTYAKRMELFYAAQEEKEFSGERLRSLDAVNISFAYPDSPGPVIENLDFHMTCEENRRLTGANGSGKSTLFSILAGLYQSQSGVVCGGAPMGQRRKSVALLEQDGAVFSGTLWENLFLPESKRPQAEKLLGEMGLKKDLDYEILPGGSKLSPGERKKILLVRALLRDSVFLLLDEPLNHLDSQAAAVLQSILAQRNGGLLLISHQDAICDSLHIQPFP